MSCVKSLAPLTLDNDPRPSKPSKPSRPSKPSKPSKRSNTSPHTSETPRQVRRREAKIKCRRKKKEKSGEEGVPVVQIPAKYAIISAPTAKTVSRTWSLYLDALQHYDTIARPTNWTKVLESNSATHLKRDRTSHPWFAARQDDYVSIGTSAMLDEELRRGLDLPAFICRESEYGQQICATASSHLDSSFITQAREILHDKAAFIDVQDHGKRSISAFTVQKTAGVVMKKLLLPLAERGHAWNLLEVADCLAGEKGPTQFKFGGKLREWQLKVGATTKLGRPQWQGTAGSKCLDQWLLVSQAQSGSFAHMDVALATWIMCLQGKKTFWLRHLQGIDEYVWPLFGVGAEKDPDILSDHELFTKPWARFDLYPGEVLIFPPGTIHAVYTPEDSVCCGGHFLVPQIMSAFIETLRKIELAPATTNDTLPLDFFQIIPNFILEVLRPGYSELTRQQLSRFILVLEEYVAQIGHAITEDTVMQEYMVQRANFVTDVEKENWIKQLKTKRDELYGR